MRLEARGVRDAKVAGSIPVTPTLQARVRVGARRSGGPKVAGSTPVCLTFRVRACW